MTPEQQAIQEMTLTEKIRLFNGGVVDNPYQGKDKKVLFVCSAGILRSGTAMRIYAKKYNTRAAGTLDIALVPLTATLIAWCHEVVFVNAFNYSQAIQKFGAENINHKCKVLNIPDTFEHMHPELIKEFEQQYEPI